MGVSTKQQILGVVPTYNGSESRLPAIGSSLPGAPGNVPAATPQATAVQQDDEQKVDAIKLEKPGEGVSATPTAAPAVTPETQSVKKALTYADMYAQLNPYKPPTADELETEKKKKKRKAIFAAIGDGVSALANIYFAGQYGTPNMFDGKNTMSGKLKEQWDKEDALRKANAEKYLSGYINARRMDADADWKDKQWQHTLEREKVQDERNAKADERADAQLSIAKAKQEREDTKAKLHNDYMQGRIDEQNYKVLIAGIDAGDRKALNEAKRYRLLHTGSGGRSGGSGGHKYTAEEIMPDGTITVHDNYDSAAEANKAQDKFDAAAGVAGTTTRTTTSETRSASGRVKGSTKSTRTGSTNKVERAADRQRIAEERRKAQQGSGGSQGGGDWRSRSQRVGGGGANGSGTNGSAKGSKKLNFG